MRPSFATLFRMTAIPLGAVFALIAGCSDGGGGGGTGGAAESACFDYATFKGDAPTVSFRNDVLPVFRQSCGLSSSCHGDATNSLPSQPFLGPKMSAPAPTDAEIASLLAGIVGKASVGEPSMAVVTAADASKSFLMYKMDGRLGCPALPCAKTSTCGTSMPQGSATLPDASLDLVRRWIQQGAKDG